jgi:hypothetical protein
MEDIQLLFNPPEYLAAGHSDKSVIIHRSGALASLYQIFFKGPTEDGMRAAYHILPQLWT